MASLGSLYRAVTYRGREGHVAWMLHRVTGVGIFLFLALHIVDIFLMSFGPGVFGSLMFIYHQFVFKLLIIFGLYLGVVYHGLNGIRIVLIDFWPRLGKRQAQLWRIQLVLFVLVYTPSAAVMLARMFDGR